jgi:hypothetical protein
MRRVLAIVAVVLIAGWGIAQDATLHPEVVSPDAVPDPTSPMVQDAEVRPGYYNTSQWVNNAVFDDATACCLPSHH